MIGSYAAIPLKSDSQHPAPYSSPGQSGEHFRFAPSLRSFGMSLVSLESRHTTGEDDRMSVVIPS